MTAKIKTIFSSALLIILVMFLFFVPDVIAQNAQNNSTVSVNKSDVANNPIVKKVLNPIVNVLSALVGIFVVGTIILGGIQYAAAGDKAEDVAKAKHRITNGVIALAAFLFSFAFLQWLIPGGVF